MDKRKYLKKIAKKLLDLGDDKNIIEGRELDQLIFSITDRLDKNIKYEFRNYLYIFELVSFFQTPEIKNNDAFIIEKKKIEEFLKNG